MIIHLDTIVPFDLLFLPHLSPNLNDEHGSLSGLLHNDFFSTLLYTFLLSLQLIVPIPSIAVLKRPLTPDFFFRHGRNVPFDSVGSTRLRKLYLVFRKILSN